MRCFETPEIGSLLHPSSIEGVADLARAEAHAAECADCAGRLTRVRSADRALAEGLSNFVDLSPCPEAEDLALAGEDFSQASDELASHLSACDECRADFLEALVNDEVALVVASPQQAPRRSRSGRAPRPSNRLRAKRKASLTWALAAAGLLSASLVGIALFQPKHGSTTAELPAKPFQAIQSPSPIKVAPAPSLPELPLVEPALGETPTLEPEQASPQDPGQTAPVAPASPSEPSQTPPRDEPTPAEEPRAEPAPDAPPRPEPSEPDQATSEPEAPLPPEPAQTPEPSSPEDNLLSVAGAEGLFVRVPGQRRFQAFESGDLPPGAVLRSQRGGARVELPSGTLFLAQEGEVQWRDGLQLTRGQVLLEGRALRVQSAMGAVDVRGRALLEVRKGKLGVQVLVGEARWARREEGEKLSAGDVLMTSGQGAPRVGRGKATGPQAVPAWVRKLRVARRRARRTGGPGAVPGGRGPRKSGGGPGGRRGGGSSR